MLASLHAVPKEPPQREREDEEEEEEEERVPQNPKPKTSVPFIHHLVQYVQNQPVTHKKRQKKRKVMLDVWVLNDSTEYEIILLSKRRV